MSAGKRVLLATSPKDPYLIALEITHPDLTVPIRVVGDTQDIVIEGNTFVACAFKLTKPDDIDQQLPHAALSIDNVGRELTQWLEYSRGGKGALCRIIEVLRSDPGTVEQDITLNMSDMSITPFEVSASLGMQKSLSQPAVAMRYDPATSIGIFD